MRSILIAAAIAIAGASALTACKVHAQTAPPFKLCTGRDDGNYFKAGHELRKRAGNVEVLTSQGSLENLDRLVKGECQGAFVQSDALLVYSAPEPR
jgi:TRAP-type uncharacterized transport system substrate-binding protein